MALERLQWFYLFHLVLSFSCPRGLVLASRMSRQFTPQQLLIVSQVISFSRLFFIRFSC